MKSKSYTGIILVLIGIVILLFQLQLFNEYFILPLIAILLLSIYFIQGGKKSYGNIGYLIPACILPVLQLIDYLDDKALFVNIEGTLSLILLALPFLMVYFAHSFWYKKVSFGQRHWPVITSGVLGIFAFITFIAEYMDSKLAEIILNNIWPVGLIIVGLIMIIKSFKSNKNLKQ